MERGIYFSGAGEQRPYFEGTGRKKRQYRGTGNIRKLRLVEQGNKPNYFRGTREQVPPPPPRGSVGPKRQILGVIRAKSDGSGESAHLSLA